MRCAAVGATAADSTLAVDMSPREIATVALVDLAAKAPFLTPGPMAAPCDEGNSGLNDRYIPDGFRTTLRASKVAPISGYESDTIACGEFVLSSLTCSRERIVLRSSELPCAPVRRSQRASVLTWMQVLKQCSPRTVI